MDEGERREDEAFVNGVAELKRLGDEEYQIRLGKHLLTGTCTSESQSTIVRKLETAVAEIPGGIDMGVRSFVRSIPRD